MKCIVYAYFDRLQTVRDRNYEKKVFHHRSDAAFRSILFLIIYAAVLGKKRNADLAIARWLLVIPFLKSDEQMKRLRSLLSSSGTDLLKNA